jgi:hypothetical protein
MTMTTVETTNAAHPIHGSASARDRRRPGRRIAAEQGRAEEHGDPRELDRARDRVQHPDRAVAGLGGLELGRQRFSVPGRVADVEGERAVHRVRVGRDDPPRDHVGAVGEVGKVRFDLTIGGARVMRRTDVDPVGLLVEHLDGAE